MKLRHLLLLAMLGLLSACATQNRKSESLAKKSVFIPEEDERPAAEITSSASAKPRAPYIGVVGYLSRPPVLADEVSQQNYQRCSPLEITSILKKDNTVFVYAKQNGNIIIFSGINRQSFRYSGGNRLPLMDKFFVKRLDVVGLPRQTASLNNKVCLGQTWAGMDQKEFLFLYGDPERKQLQKTTAGNFDVWSYGMSADSRHYYFRAQHLYSWTQ